MATFPIISAATYTDSSESSAQHETPAFTPDGSPLFVAVHVGSGSTAGDEDLTSITIGAEGRGFGTGTALTRLGGYGINRATTFIYVISAPATSEQTIQVETANGTPRGIRITVHNSTGVTGAKIGSAVEGGAFGTELTPGITTAEDGSVVMYSVFAFNATTVVTTTGATEVDNGNTGDTNAFRDGYGVLAFEEAATAGAYSANFNRDPTSQNIASVVVELEAAPTGGITIEAATGQIRATGSNAALIAQRLLAAETGAAAVDGVDATLAVSRMMALNTGAAAVTGSALDLIRSLVLAAETGAAAVTGSDLSLTQASVLSLNSGALAATGSNATLLRSLILAAETGAGAVTGADASLVAGLVLSLATGQVAVTGADASLITQSVLALVSGAAAAAGQDAAFLRSLLIQAETGGAAVTGSDLDLLARRVIEAATGGAAITGSDADLLRSLVLDMQTGQAAITGYPLSLLGALVYFYSFPQDSLRSGTLIAPERSGTVSRHEV